MKKILGFMGLVVALLALSTLPSFGVIRDAQDISIYPIQTDLATAATYSEEVIATATDTVTTIATWDFNTYEPSNILWCYFDINLYIKGDATQDVIWRIEVKEPSDSNWHTVDKYYTITSSNDVIILTTAGGGQSSIDIPDGVYTGDELATALQTAIRADGTLTITTATVTYSSTTHKFTLDGETDTIAVTFSGSDGATTVGFDRDVSAATEVTTRFATPAHFEASLANSYQQRNYKGYIHLDSSKVDEVPFQVRVVFECDKADIAYGKVKNDTYIRCVYKEYIGG